ncbi:hypothetical protein ACHAXT_007061 [Thalassiosira profunda]
MATPAPLSALLPRLLLVVVVGIVALASTATCAPNGPDGITSHAPISSRPLFGVRGGAFFGFGRSKSQGGGGGDDDLPKRFPALSESEIENLLNIPVFGLTDASGNGVVLSENGNNIFHFFFSKHMADAALKAVVAANENKGAPALKVSAFHLGKCWFKLINGSGSQTFKLEKYGNGNDPKDGKGTAKPVHFRLVPNQKDLMGARVLTGLQPGDVEQLKEAVEEPDPPKAISIIQNAANRETCSFTTPFNEIPVFAIAQMRVRKKDEQTGMPVGENMMPFHLSTKTMSETWSEFVKQSPQFEDAEATLQLIELHKMIDMMQHESDFDWRHVVFVMPDYDQDQPRNDLDDSDDDSDEGGGGDNGMRADDSYGYDDIEPYVSMELYADIPGETLVQI